MKQGEDSDLEDSSKPDLEKDSCEVDRDGLAEDVDDLRISDESKTAQMESPMGIKVPGGIMSERDRVSSSRSALRVHEIGRGKGFGTRHVQQKSSMPILGLKEEEISAKARSEKLRRQNTKDEWMYDRQKGFGSWLILTASGCLLLIVITLLIYLGTQNGSPTARQPDISRDQLDEESLSLVDKDLDRSLRNLEQRKSEALALFEEFSTSLDPESIRAIVVNPEKNLPLIERSRTAEDVDKVWGASGETNWQLEESNGNACAVLFGRDLNQRPFTAYFVDIENELLLDWRATVGYGTASFKELSEGNGDGSEIRGIASIANFYTLAYPDSEYFCLRFLGPDQQSHIWVYCKSDSELAAYLKARLDGRFSGQDKSVMAKLVLHLVKDREDAFPNQWKIDNLLSSDWLEGQGVVSR